MKIRKLFRFEKDQKNGCWYNENAQYHCTDTDLRNHPMPSEPQIYKGIYSSSCETLEELLWRIPKNVAKRLVEKGYVFAVYESDDYFSREHGEICFNKQTAISRKVIHIDL